MKRNRYLSFMLNQREVPQEGMITEFLCHDSGKYIGRIVERHFDYASDSPRHSTYKAITEKEMGTPLQCGEYRQSMSQACEDIKEMTEPN